MDDPVVFQATIHYAAVHLEMLGGIREHTKIITMTTQTIRMINVKLQRSEGTPDESTISATAMLAAAEVRLEPLCFASIAFVLSLRTDFLKRSRGNMAELRIHTMALGKMVRLRGGLKAIESLALWILLCWYDYFDTSGSPYIIPPTNLLHGW